MDKPLISIVVLTYNSSEYILETLDSAFRQTYSGDLELIISDDKSEDRTVALCKEWVQVHGERFAKVTVLEAEENTGISKNINRGCRAAEGQWIKTIAGDDILTDDCIDILFTTAQTIGEQCAFVAAPILVFQDGIHKFPFEGIVLESWNPAGLSKTVTLSDQLLLDPYFWLPAPSFFVSKRLLESIGYYPEVYRNLEDAPMLRKVLSRGYHIDIADRPVVYYRLRKNSLVEQNKQDFDYRELVISMYELFLKPVFDFRRRWNYGLQLLPLKINIRNRGKVTLIEKLSAKLAKFCKFRLS